MFRRGRIWSCLRLVHAVRICAWNSVPSVQMAWRMTAILRATMATFAFLVPFGQLAAPTLERRTSSGNGQQDVRGLEQISSNLVVAAFGDAAHAIDLTGLMTSWY